MPKFCFASTVSHNINTEGRIRHVEKTADPGSAEKASNQSSERRAFSHQSWTIIRRVRPHTIDPWRFCDHTFNTSRSRPKSFEVFLRWASWNWKNCDHALSVFRQSKSNDNPSTSFQYHKCPA